MSLILEALRRSETERHLGRAPGVLAPMPVLRATPRPRRGRWWLLLALVLTALALWAGWRAAHRDQPQTGAVTATTNPPVASSGMRAAPAIPATQPEFGAIPAPPPPIVSARPEPAPASIDPAATRKQTQQAMTGGPQAPAVPRFPVSAAVPPALDNPAPTQTQSQPQPPESADLTSGSADALEAFADLAPAERAALPPLKISMHVYAEQPGDRFMIVDGQRVGEGARIGARIVLVRIRRDGAVLDIGGRRLLLPKP